MLGEHSTALAASTAAASSLAAAAAIAADGLRVNSRQPDASAAFSSGDGSNKRVLAVTALPEAKRTRREDGYSRSPFLEQLPHLQVVLRAESMVSRPVTSPAAQQEAQRPLEGPMSADLGGLRLLPPLSTGEATPGGGQSTDDGAMYLGSNTASVTDEEEDPPVATDDEEDPPVASATDDEEEAPVAAASQPPPQMGTSTSSAIRIDDSDEEGAGAASERTAAQRKERSRGDDDGDVPSPRCQLSYPPKRSSEAHDCRLLPEAGSSVEETGARRVPESPTHFGGGSRLQEERDEAEEARRDLRRSPPASPPRSPAQSRLDLAPPSYGHASPLISP